MQLYARTHACARVRVHACLCACRRAFVSVYLPEALSNTTLHPPGSSSLGVQPTILLDFFVVVCVSCCVWQANARPPTGVFTAGHYHFVSACAVSACVQGRSPSVAESDEGVRDSNERVFNAEIVQEKAQEKEQQREQVMEIEREEFVDRMYSRDHEEPVRWPFDSLRQSAPPSNFYPANQCALYLRRPVQFPDYMYISDNYFDRKYLHHHLCCVVLRSVVLCCVVLCCVVLCCVVLCCVVLCCVVLRCVVLCCVVLCCVVLCCVVRCIRCSVASRSVALHGVTWHCVALRSYVVALCGAVRCHAMPCCAMPCRAMP